MCKVDQTRLKYLEELVEKLSIRLCDVESKTFELKKDNEALFRMVKRQ